ncbi:hypothetical protein BH09BAC1_BH09BAC1_04250 [soil metagenome]
MKKTLLLAIASLLSIAVYAQKKSDNSQPPEVVKTAFTKKYPAVNKISWNKEEDGYEAEFTFNGKETSATFTAHGVLIEIEVEIATTELPKTATEYIKANYANYKVKEAAKITDDKNTTTFEAEVSKNGKSMDIIFDANGSFIKVITD